MEYFGDVRENASAVRAGSSCTLEAGWPRGERAYLHEPIGLENETSCCWLNSLLQLVCCIKLPLDEETTDGRLKTLRQAIDAVITEMETSQSRSLEAST
jgi:hypothetical protein